VVDQVFFQLFDVSIGSGDIHDQSGKLSEIASKFGHFLALPNFRRRAFQNLHPHYHPSLPARGLEKFHEGTATSREVIMAHRLNFRPNFKFSRLLFCGGGPRPNSGVRQQGLVNL